MFQLIHWFSSNQDFENKDTVALLDTLMDGIVCPTDTALRDFSAKCIKEFLKWSLKQKKKKVHRITASVLFLLRKNECTFYTVPVIYRFYISTIRRWKMKMRGK